jgi:hypothetical protein
MAALQDVEENDGEIDRENTSSPNNISFGFRNRQRPEEIKIPRRRGRPPGSTNRNTSSRTKSTTGVEQLWSEGAALILGFSSAVLAQQIMNNRKYVMTEAEAKSAATGLIVCLFQYKQIREFALATKIDTPWAIALRGFWPYLSRVFVKDIIENVIMGFNKPKQPERNTGRNSNRESNSGPIRSSNVPPENGDNFNPSIIIGTDWRDDG